MGVIRLGRSASPRFASSTWPARTTALVKTRWPSSSSPVSDRFSRFTQVVDSPSSCFSREPAVRPACRSDTVSVKRAMVFLSFARTRNTYIIQ